VAGGTAEIRPVPGAVDEWVLTIDGIAQSHVDLADPTHLVHEYVGWIAASVDAATPAGALSCVHLGAGAGTLARWVATTRPGSRQVVLDPDAALLDAVRATLGLPRAGLRVRAEDGRAGLARLPDDSHQVVIRDAFVGTAVPPHLMTVEFVAEVARVLTSTGVYLTNVGDRAPFATTAVDAATVRAVLPHVAAVSDPATLRGRRTGNVVLVASRADLSAVVDRLTRVLASAPLPARVLRDEALRSRLPGSRPRRDADPPLLGPPPARWS
jgi:spermidine synthase